MGVSRRLDDGMGVTVAWVGNRGNPAASTAQARLGFHVTGFHLREFRGGLARSDYRYGEEDDGGNPRIVQAGWTCVGIAKARGEFRESRIVHRSG